MSIQLLSVSSKGQIALPVDIREELNINTGDKLLVACDEDTIILKKVALPSKSKIEHELKKARKFAKKEGIDQEFVNKVIKEVRNKSE